MPERATLGTYTLSGAKASDWRTSRSVRTGAGQSYLYLGDIGDNGSPQRHSRLSGTER
ncbi:PE-PGRS family domain protein [Mycobacterium ulcerans str. Harvey]|uniref:PE-PGRS family domain protein n=1 Tax=Mycobacterium ulcerans str. Harvey TaxID=1299332 RepID=A0ABP3A227_MYCUL|nr:PE-PGRS family domain protein [Mycobacterium ulcerans str. Harvey]